MTTLDRVETKTQEVTFLITVVGASSAMASFLMFLFLNSDSLTSLNGHWGHASLQFVFNSFGLSTFIAPVLLLKAGQLIVSRITSIKEIKSLSKIIFTETVLSVLALAFFASLFTIFQSYFGFNTYATLENGAGGSIGLLLGGTLFKLIGMLGSLVIAVLSFLIVGISMNRLHIVPLVLENSERIVNLRKSATKFSTKQAKTAIEQTPVLLGDVKDLAIKSYTFLKESQGSNINVPKADEQAQLADEFVVERFHELPDSTTDEKPVLPEVGIADSPKDATPEQTSKSAELDETPQPLKKVRKKRASKSSAKKQTAKIIEKQTEDSANNETASNESTTADDNQEEPQFKVEIKPYKSRYVAPSEDLLSKPKAGKKPSEAEVSAQCGDLEERLASFQIHGKVVTAHTGARLTMYEFQPDPGVKVSKITGLASDLALLLGAESIRILTPIPGKTTVGIEVPNKQQQPVSFPKLVKQVKSEKSKLPIALGENVYGDSVIADIASMPHLLVSGTTGSGKSVFINTLICSLLYKQSPKDLRFIMIDPKMIELSPYNGIPHLMQPVITDVSEAKDALVWAEKEMDKRYTQFAEMGARNLESFNEQIKKSSQKKIETKLKRKIDWAWMELPQIVVIIDELADLMITQGKDVEIPITRIAQKARAAGIHLVIATQRPSAEIVTGLIKTNFPTRIAFKVSSSIDSRTILDASGAEKLLGLGDMLFMPNGKALERIQGTFISEDEVKKIVSRISS